MATYIYVRVSTVEQAEGSSLEEQLRRCRAVAMYHGTKVTREYQDPGVSGTIPLEERKNGSKLNAKLEKGDTVIVAKLDRMFRTASDALKTADDFKKRGVDLILADIGMDPVTHNGTGKLFFSILASVAEFERERIAERLNEGREAKKQIKGYIGGKRPFGYRIVGQGKESYLRKVRSEQDAIEHMKALREEGVPFRQISDVIWEKHQFRMPPMSIKRILDREGRSSTPTPVRRAM